MDEGMPAQDFHSQAISPALPFKCFQSPTSCSASAFLDSHPTQQIVKTANPAVKGQSSPGCTFLQRLRGKQRGWKEASLGKGPPLTHPHMVSTAATQGFYQEPHRGAFSMNSRYLVQKAEAQSLYAGTYKLYMKHSYAGKKP